MRAGSNRWKNSAVRQWLNSRGSNWFTPQEDFDLPPSHAGKRGFMTGFDETFLRAVRPIRLTTATDTLGTVDVTYDRFFLPSVQEMNVTPQVADAEGGYLAFWREAEGAGDYVGTGSGNSFECLRVKDIKTDAARGLLLRSANVNNDYALRRLMSTGYVAAPASNAAYYAEAAGYVSPLCALC